MSIIHDALKKAEGDRAKGPPVEPVQPVRPEQQRPLSGTNPFKIDPPQADRPKTSQSQVILLVVALLALGGVVYWRVLHKSAPSHRVASPAPKPITAESATGATDQPNAPLSGLSPFNGSKSPDKLRQEAMETFEIGDFEKSAEQWSRLTLLAPTDPEVYNNLGLALKKLNKNKESRDAYEKALGLDSDYPEALNNLGVLLMGDKDMKRAKGLFEKAVQLNPKYGEAFFHLAMVLENEGDYTGAVNNYQEFLSLKPEADSALKAQVEIRIAVLKAEADRAR